MMKRLLGQLCGSLLLRHIVYATQIPQLLETFVSVSRVLCYGKPNGKFYSSDMIS